MKADLLIDCRCELGEGPVWDETSGTLWWVDIDGRRLHEYRPADGLRREYELPEKVGAFALRRAGGFIMAAANGWAWYDANGGTWTPIADPEPNRPNHRFNDGKCDSSGRFYAGTYSQVNRAEAFLYVMEPDLSWRPLLDGIVCSNGLTWSPDDKTMYYTDSPTQRIDRIEYDAATGGISGRETAIVYAEPGVLPDGMTSDEEGMLWVAEWGGWKVSRWNPHTGERLMTVEVPAKHVTSCAFGGDGMDELFITTATAGLSEEERREQPHAGGVFHAKVGVKGRRSCRFAG